MALRFSRNASSPKAPDASRGVNFLRRRPVSYRSRAAQFRLATVVFAILGAIVAVDRFAFRDRENKPASISQAASSAVSHEENPPQEERPESAASRSCRAGWAEVYGALREDEKSLLFRVFGFTRRSRACPETLNAPWRETHARLEVLWEAYLDRARESLAGKTELAPDQQNAWREVVEQTATHRRAVLDATGDPSQSGKLDLGPLAEAQSFLDALALAEIRDDTVYRHAEKEIWFRLIERLQSGFAADLPPTAVDYIPLHRQSERYRGRLVQVRGQIELAYRVAAPINDLGVEAYYIFWLRPSTGAAKPILVYALRLPEGLPWRESEKRSAAPRVEIECRGYFFKRLAYRAAKGIETAPLVVAAQPIVVGEERESAASGATPTETRRLAAIVLAAAALASVAILFVVRRTRSPRRRSPSKPIALLFLLLLAAIWPPLAPAQLGELPWETQAQEAREGDSPLREAFIGVDDDELAALRDGQTLSDDERATLYKTLNRLPRVGHGAWGHPGVKRAAPSLGIFASAGLEHRLAPFSLSGRATAIARRELTRDEAERFEFSAYYETQIELDDSGETVLVAARSAPKQWLGKSSLAEPVAVRGVFFKVVATKDGESPLFAADRVQWLPAVASASLGVEPSHVRLAELGMDVGLFDDVRSENGRGIGRRDGDCLEALLAAASGADEKKLQQTALRNFDIGELLRRPEREHGRLYALRFKARRITRVLREESKGNASSPGYYQIDGFLPLGDQVVRLDSQSKTSSGDESPTFRNNFPATLCVLEIPEGWLKPNESSRELNETIEANAFFFKLWTYRSSYISKFDPAGRQPSPLFVGRQARVAPAPAPSKRYLGAAAAGAFVVAIAVLWIGSRIIARGDRRHTAKLRDRFQQKPVGPIGPPPA